MGLHVCLHASPACICACSHACKYVHAFPFVCMSMHGCMCAYISACMQGRIHVCMHACVCACMLECMLMSMIMFMLACAYAYDCVHALVHMCMQMNMRASICAYMHACMHVWVHGCVHACVPACLSAWVLCMSEFVHTCTGVGNPIRTLHIFALWKCANVRSHILLLFKNVWMCNRTFCRSLKMCQCVIAHFVAL